MAGRKENLKALFTNTRSRVIILFTITIMIIAVVIGVIKFSSFGKIAPKSSANIAAAPGGIESLPGALNQTAQYASLQQLQNVNQAKAAYKTGKSAIPTIIRAQAFGNGVEAIGPKNGTGAVGFATLEREDTAGPQQSLWIQTVKDGNCSKSSVQNVMKQGAILSDIKSACTCAQLKDDGFKLTDLQQTCSCKALKAAGFNARQMKDVGFSAAKLRLCGFDACELRGAGYTALEMKDGGFSDGELKGAGFTDKEIAKASGLPDGVTPDDILKSGCDVAGLNKLHKEGVTAAAVARISGCSSMQLHAAGYNAKELRNAGFSAAELKKDGFTPAQLKQAGFSARDLLNAGFMPADLSAAGFTPAELKEAEQELPPGVTPDDIKKSGCNVDALKRERAAGISAISIHQDAGCDASALKDAGYTNSDLENAGFTPAAIKAASAGVSDGTIQTADCDISKLKSLMIRGVSAKRIHELNGCSAQALREAGFGVKALAEAGFKPRQLIAAGFTPKELVDGGFNQEQLAGMKAVDDKTIQAAGCSQQNLRVLYEKGVTAKRIHKLNGCSVEALKKAGYDKAELADAGFTPQQLLAAGFTPSIDDAAIHAAGCSVPKLKQLAEAGVSARRVSELNGCSLEALKAAGYDAKQLADAGFTPEQLLAAGFTPAQLMQAGLSPTGVIAAGRTADCSPASLKAAHSLGVSALTIKQTLGCSAKDMKAAGYSASELANAGYTAGDLKHAGFSAAELKNAGFGAKELASAGFSPQQLKEAGFSKDQLKNAGLKASDLKTLGLSAEQLKAEGYGAKTLKDAGYTAEELRKAGYSAEELKDAGFSAAALHAAGFTAENLKNAGFSVTQLKNAGYSSQELQNAGFSVPGLAATTIAPLTVNTMPSLAGSEMASNKNAAEAAEAAANTQQLQKILKRQQVQMADQRYQQKIQQRSQGMSTAASQAISAWKLVPGQIYMGGTAKDKAGTAGDSDIASDDEGSEMSPRRGGAPKAGGGEESKAIVKAGDVLFAVLDTSVNSDEPGPILATIVSGKFNGAKLIGSFNRPSNADKMVINFNTMSVPGAAHTTSISAYAIDPNTARTALASRVNHHYLLRYGSLFAATFLEGFGNAFQSANTTVTIGGVGGATNTTISNGVGRSIMENAVIGLATLGKSWSQVAMQEFSLPTTVDLYSGTGLGILFTQDLKSL